MYEDGHTVKGLKKLPLNQLDAIRLFEKNKVVRAGLGDELVAAYAKMRHQEWSRFCASITPWEMDNTLDC